MSEIESRALAEFAADVRKLYGARLKGLYLFGSRARGDAVPESDADVLVVLVDDGWSFWAEKKKLISLAYDTVLNHDLYVQAWPVTHSDWQNASKGDRGFLPTAKHEAVPIREAA